jgi:FtsP/CotA-like multicopper oxidase with cupredoxin domain
MTRRELLALACSWTAAAAAASGQHRMEQDPARAPAVAPAGDADITLRIGETTVDLARGRSVRTLAYNGQVPGPVLRATQGKPLIVDVWNDSQEVDIVHWHGFHIAPEVDGAYEEGTPGVPPNGGRQRYVFTPDPAGTRWYHSHAMAGRNLRKGTYSGQFGLFIVEDGREPGAYDQDVPLLLHEWDGRFSTQGDVEFKSFSINGKMLGAGEPIRVQSSQRVLFRIVNASATLHHRLALPGHRFHVTALDGNAVPSPASVPIVDVGPGERVDAIVEMNRPGVWVLGEIQTGPRTAGMGVVVEYENQQGPPRWERPENFTWDYTIFGGREAVPEPDGRLTMAFKAAGDGHHWTINGKSYPRTDPIIVQANKRYRWTLDNQSAEAHPVHLHRHRFELVRFADQPVSGVWKDVIVVPAWKQVEIDVPATQPGLSLFHCHQQFHMDMGFMALMRYASSTR